MLGTNLALYHHLLEDDSTFRHLCAWRLRRPCARRERRDAARGRGASLGQNQIELLAAVPRVSLKTGWGH